MNKFLHLVFALTLLVLNTPFASAETILARVENRVITLEELKITLNSTPNTDPNAEFQRDENNPLFKLLVNVIDSELLYLEANIKGVKDLPEFKREFSSYSDSMLADEFQKKLLKKNLKLSPKSIKDYAKANNLTTEAAKALIRKEKRRKLLNGEMLRLFDKYKVKYSTSFAKKDIKDYLKDEVLVTSKGFNITYSDISRGFNKFGTTKNDLLDYLSQVVEIKLFSLAAKKEGLDKSEAYRDIAGEYERSLAINIYRQNFLSKSMPTKNEVDKFLIDNDYLAKYPQKVAALLVVCNTKEEAESVREMSMAGANFYNLAVKYSIAPNAKINAGDIGPITIGDKPLNQVDWELLKLEIGEVSYPLKGYQGYSIFKMLEKGPVRERPRVEMELIAKKAILERKLFNHLEELRKKKRVEIYDPKSHPES